MAQVVGLDSLETSFNKILMKFQHDFGETSMDLRKRKDRLGFVLEACGRRGINVRNS